MNDVLIKDGSDRLRKFVNGTCAIFVLLLITILFLHKGSFEKISAVIHADAAVKAKYGNLQDRLVSRVLGIYTNPDSTERLYVVEF